MLSIRTSNIDGSAIYALRIMSKKWVAKGLHVSQGLKFVPRWARVTDYGADPQVCPTD